MPTEIDPNVAGNGDPYSHNDPLQSVFGESGKVKIISALLSEKDTDLNVSDISRVGGVARSTVYDNMDGLQEMGIVVQTREIGGSPMYQINTDNEIVEYIDQIRDLALERLLELNR